MADYLNIAGRVRTTASDGVAMEAQEVKDLNLNKSQQEINADVQTELGDRYTKEETYSKEQLDDLITTPDVNYVSVVATNATTAVTDILPATGEANTIYRVGNWNGTQYDTTMYALFAWNGTTYVCLAVRSFVGEVYDISVNHPDGQGNPTPYADLAAAIGTSGANIPADIRRGGMSIKFIQGNAQSSDNKYVQARCMAQNFTTDVTQWQGVDEEPNAGSDNLVKSGGIKAVLDDTNLRNRAYNNKYFVPILENQYTIGYYYNIPSTKKVGDLFNINPTTRSDGAYLNIEVQKNDILYIDCYVRNIWYVCLDTNDTIRQISSSYTGKVDEHILINQDGRFILSLSNIGDAPHNNNLNVFKLTERKSEGSIKSVSIDGHKIYSTGDDNASLDIPLGRESVGIYVDGVNSAEKEILPTDLETYGFWGQGVYTNDNSYGQVYYKAPSDSSTEQYRSIIVECVGYDYIITSTNNITGNQAIMYYDEDMNCVRASKINTDPALLEENLLRYDIPKNTKYVLLTGKVTTTDMSSFYYKLVKESQVPLKDLEDYRIYKKNIRNGLLNIVTTVSGNNYSFTLPVSINDRILCRTMWLPSIILKDENGNTIKSYNSNDTTGRVTQDGDFYNVDVLIVNPDIKTVVLTIGVYSKRGLTPNFLCNTELSIKKDEDSYEEIPVCKYDLFLRGQAKFDASKFVHVSPGDTVMYSENQTMEFPCVRFYDANKNYVGTIPKYGVIGISGEVPVGASYVQFLSFADYTNKTPGKVIRNHANVELYTQKVTKNDGIYSEVLYRNLDKSKIFTIDDVDYYLKAPNNISCLVTPTERYIVCGSAELMKLSDGTKSAVCITYRYSDDKGVTWSDIKIAFENLKWSSESVPPCSAPTLTINNNGRIFIMFGTSNNSAVEADLGVLSNASERRMLYIYSDDNGETWSNPIDITEVIISKFGEVIKLVYPSCGSGHSKNGTLIFPTYFYQTTEIPTGSRGFVIYSVDDGETWHCTNFINIHGNSFANETAVCELQDNLFMVLERSQEGVKNRKEVYTLNVANKEEHESWTLKHDEILSSYRAFNEPDGFGEEGETVGVARFKANDHYIYLYAAQVDDTHNISLLASTTLEKFIPVAYLKRDTASTRNYTLMSVYKDNILCVTRDGKEVVAYIANGIVNRLESIGQSDAKTFVASPIEFDAEDSDEVKTQKLNALVQTLVNNRLMKGWRDYTLKMAYSCESQPSKPYDDFIKSATNQGVMYSMKKIEGNFRIRITLPAQNVTSEATTVKFATTWNSGASKRIYNAPISRDEEFVIAEYEGNNLPYGEALFVWFYEGVAQSAITTDGVKVEIFE